MPAAHLLATRANPDTTQYKPRHLRLLLCTSVERDRGLKVFSYTSSTWAFIKNLCSNNGQYSQEGVGLGCSMHCLPPGAGERQAVHPGITTYSRGHSARGQPAWGRRHSVPGAATCPQALVPCGTVPCSIKPPQANKDRNKLWCLAYVLTQRVGLSVGMLHLRCSDPFRHLGWSMRGAREEHVA